MAITPVAPITVPGVVIDTYWLSKLIVQSPKISAPNALPSQDASAMIELLPYNAGSLQPVPERAVRIEIKNIFAKVAAGDTDLGTILGLILSYAQKEARSQGKI